MTVDKERAAIAAKVLDAWGSAIRGNWGDIDGRSCQSELWLISAFLEGRRDTLTPADVGVCVEGDYSPHWMGDGMGHTCKDGL